MEQLLNSAAGFFGPFWVIIWTLVKIIVIVAPLMGIVAYLTLAERKVIGWMQIRMGPNRVTFFGISWLGGLAQPVADGMKMLFKEVIIPTKASTGLYFLGPILALAPALAAWAVVPFADGIVLANINAGLLFLMAITGLGVYGVIIAGWASNSKYAFLSALRAAAQMVSYEVSIGFVMITVLLFAGSLNISQIVAAQETTGVLSFLHWNAFSILFPMLVIFFVSSLAETQRPPFDLLEAESELVAGFFVEYSSGPFLLFFLAEYMNVIMLCAMMSILFLGGWLSPINIWPLNIPVLGIFWFLLKTAFLFFMMAMVKAMVPRYRYDQLMRLGWKVFLPTSLLWVVLTAAWVLVFHHHA